MKKPRKSAPKLNPFEVHINKQKMAVLGRKLKHDRGLPGVSRAKAIKKRKETLLQEYKVKNKSNRFIDKRIGERNKDMTGDDKTLARFAAIRKKAHRKSIFNLADDEVLTHKGQTLAEIEKFDDPKSEDDDLEDDSGNLTSNFVEDAHFGGGILKKTGKEGAKTHRELIDELISESKKRKAEKQKTKEATLELTEKLDTEWKDLLPLVNKSQTKERQMFAPDDYDKIMRELRFEARGTVSDRLKTEDEVAKEEKERLEELEKERQERMRGLREEDRQVNHRSADDLDDDVVYQSDPEYMLTYNDEGQSNVKIDVQVTGKNDEEDNEDIDDDENEDVDDENKGSEEQEAESEDDMSDLKAASSDESDGEEIKSTKIAEDLENRKKSEYAIKTDLQKRKEMMDVARTELPYTFALPDSYEAFQKLFEDQSSCHQSVIVERMIKCNHPSLGEKNKDNLGVLFVYLLQHLNDCASEGSIVLCFDVFAKLTPRICELAQIDELNAHNSVKEVIKEKHDDFKKRSKRRPGLELLIFFKLVSLLFSTSDFRHQVVTPCFVFMEQILHKCRVKSRSDIAYGLFLVTLVLEYTVLSKRLLPAAINYLGGIIHMAIPKVVKLLKVNPPFKCKSSLLVLVSNFTDDVKLKLEPSDLVIEDIDDSFRVRALYTTLKLIEEFSNIFATLPSRVEIFSDIFTYLELLPTQNYPKSHRDLYEKITRQLKNEKSQRTLDYVVMEAKKPKALRLYEPKFGVVFDGKRRKVQSKEKAERDKLLHKFKKETKGAMREIRKDKAFIGRVKIQELINSDNMRREKVKRIYSEAALQQSELNSLERKKKRK